MALQVVPTGLLSHPENVLFQVGIAVLQLLRDLLCGGAFLLQLGQKFEATSVESIGHIFEENQTEDDVLVLGRIHGAAQLVSRLPEGVLEFLDRGGSHIWEPTFLRRRG